MTVILIDSAGPSGAHPCNELNDPRATQCFEHEFVNLPPLRKQRH